MKTLIFASHNSGKAKEITRILGHKWTVITLKEAGINIDIPEPFFTLEENARQKSTSIYDLNHLDCFGEDTGLEVAALKGAPGVRSARYAGDEATDEENIHKLLTDLLVYDDRQAQFRTVVSLILKGEEYQFEGICAGNIARAKQGNFGFGYDSVFVPDGSEKTFAEMEGPEKDLFSHRRKALEKMAIFLEKFGYH